MTITNGYVTLALLKQELGAGADTGDDPKMERAISSASRQIDKYVGRPHGFWQDATVTTREYYSEDSRMCFVDDISTVTGLVVKTDINDDGNYSQTLTVGTNFILGPLNSGDETPVRPYNWIKLVDYGTSMFYRYSSGRPNVSVTAKFGWANVPDDVVQACLVQAAHLYKASASVLGLVQLGMEGNAWRLSSKLNPIAEGLLADYVVKE